MFHGFDFDSTMLRIAAMNLMLHGVDAPAFIIRQRQQLPDRFPYAHNSLIVLVNPPFKGSLDYDDVPQFVGIVKTKRLVVVFGSYPTDAESRRTFGDHCARWEEAGSSKAHQALRQMLITTISWRLFPPSGVFNPMPESRRRSRFLQGRQHRTCFMTQADGFSLDDKRDPITTMICLMSYSDGPRPGQRYRPTAKALLPAAGFMITI